MGTGSSRRPLGGRDAGVSVPKFLDSRAPTRAVRAARVGTTDVSIAPIDDENGPSDGGGFLLEDGSGFLLLESGGFLLLE